MQIAIISLFIAVSGLLFFFFYFQKQMSQLQKQDDGAAQRMILQLMNDMRKELSESQGKNRQELDARLHKMSLLLKESQNASMESMQKQFRQSSAIVREVTKNLTDLQATNKQVVNFAAQMESLERVLKSPKQRGILGEYALETLLSNHLHGNFEMQHKMKNGEIVDAAIFFNGLTIPVDSKFSLENYNKMVQETDDERRSALEKVFKADVKKRIDETAKYIRPQDGTTEFAFMFIPAEGVYYNLTIYNVGSGSVNTRNLMEYAFEKRVIIVSPSSFFAYLQTVIQGMKALEIGENVTRTLKGIETLGKHVNAYEEYMKKLGKHLGTTVNTYNHASREFKKIDKDVYKLTDGKTGGQVLLEPVEKPLEDSV